MWNLLSQVGVKRLAAPLASLPQKIAILLKIGGRGCVPSGKRPPGKKGQKGEVRAVRLYPFWLGVASSEVQETLLWQ